MDGRKVIVGRPVMPDGYGIPQDQKGLISWNFVEEKMAQAINYWVSSTRPDGRPHAMPVWGVWVDGAFYFEGSLETRRARNLLNNPAVVVHLESGSEVVILEGVAVTVDKPEPGLAQILSQDFSRKYKNQGYEPGPDNWDQGGLFRMTPQRAFAWTRFPADTTRWVFE
jgi:hypothetical protein